MAKKVSKKQPKTAGPAASAGRVRKLDKKLQKARAKQVAKKQTPMPGSFKLTKQVLITIKNFWKPLGGIFIVYLLLNVVFATGLVSDLNSTADNIVASHHLGTAIHGFGSLVGSDATANSANATVAQGIMLVLESLVIIWALRQLVAGEAVKVKEAYYRAMTPLVPFLVVVAVIVLQLLPVTLGSTVLAALISSAFVSGPIVTILFGIVLAALTAWSVYMISGSIFALYIITLPDMMPRQALLSAKNLVKYRRWQIMRRLVFLPITILLLMGIVIVPLILFLSFTVAIAFFVLSMLAVLFAHTYLYNLYRGLIA